MHRGAGLGAGRSGREMPRPQLRRCVPAWCRSSGRASLWAGARAVLLLAMVCRSGAVCGDGVPDEGEECDDGNVFTGDGCSGDCKTERIAFQVFYNSSDCTGKVWKMLVFDDREYVRSKNANAELRSRRLAPHPLRRPYRVTLADCAQRRG